MKQISWRTAGQTVVEQVKARHQLLSQLGRSVEKRAAFEDFLFDPEVAGSKNCENLIGQVAIPLGVAGPVWFDLRADKKQRGKQEQILLPLATTEGALVASVNRGCKALSQASLVEVVVEQVGMSRAPVFNCPSPIVAQKFVSWLEDNQAKLAKSAETTSSHLKFLSWQIFREDNLVFVRFNFDTDQAMGMNMVSIGVQRILGEVQAAFPTVKMTALSSNMCTDKKVSGLNRRLGRGRRVRARVLVAESVLEEVLKTTLESFLLTYHDKIEVGSRLAELLGANMHFANIGAAMLLATGQDIAHSVDLSAGDTAAKVVDGQLELAVDIPSLPVGVIGGGTGLTTQAQARALIASDRVDSDLLSATIGVGILAGELSGLAALSSNTLACAHQQLAR